MRRRDVLKAAGAGAASLTLPRIGWAQPEGTKFVASMIGSNPPPNRFGIEWSAAIEEGLAEQGWIDGQNLRIEHRFSPGVAELSEAQAAELIAMNPDLFMTGSTNNAVVVQRLNLTIPWVFTHVGDPLGLGLVESFARPGGNVTGFAHLEHSVGGVLVELLLEVAPETSRIHYFTNPSYAGGRPEYMLPFAEAAAAAFGLPLEMAFVETEEEIEPTIAGIAAVPGAGMIVTPNNWIHNRARVILDAIERYPIPAVFSSFQILEGGGLIGVGVDPIAGFRLGGDYAGRILNGAHPSDLPVQAPPYTIRVNLRTAAAQGITIPTQILATVDRVYE